MASSTVLVRPWKVALALGIVYVVWGSAYLAIRIGVNCIPPATLAGSRFLVAGIVLMAAAMARREPMPRSAREWLTAAGAGLCLLLLGNGMLCWAEERVSSGLAALIICSTPLWILSMEAALPRGERLSSRDVAGLLIGCLGIAVLVGPQLGALPGAPATQASAAGVLALIGSAFSWALGSTIARHARMPASIWTASAVEMIAGGTALLVAAPALGEWARFSPSSITSRAWIAWIYLVFVSSIVAFSAYNWLLANVRPSLATTYAYVNPVVAVVLGVVVLGEKMGPSTILGAAITVAAVAVVTRRRSPGAYGVAPHPSAAVRTA